MIYVCYFHFQAANNLELELQVDKQAAAKNYFQVRGAFCYVTGVIPTGKLTSGTVFYLTILT